MKPIDFEQPTAEGSLRLQVPSLGPQPRDPAGAALALANCEGLLLALETWLGRALDPSPLEGDAAVPADAVTAQVNDPALAPAGTALAVPLALLQAHPQLPDCLGGDALAWTPFHFDVELARYERLPLPDDAPASGGVLLLPGSFQAAWPVRLLHRGLGIDWPAAWRGPGSAFELDAMPRARPPEPGEPAAWRVILSAGLNIDVARALAGDMPALRLDGEAATRAALFGPLADTPIAHGRVVPALQGAALWLAPGPAPVTPASAATRPHALPA